MKIIHCADLHLNSKMESNLTKEKAKTRRLELLDTFERMVNFAKDNNVKIIIIAGDMFDTAYNEQNNMKKYVLSIIKDNPNIDFLYLRGNHDKIDYFTNLLNKPSNLKTFTEEWCSYVYDKVVITGCEIAKDNNDIYDTLNLYENNINFLVLHGQESLSNGADATEIINLRKLKDKNIDYLALGHIHSYKCAKLDSRGIYCYCGCLEGRGFDECGEKGFVLIDVDLELGQVHPKFVPFAKRTIHEVHVNLNTNMIEEDVRKAISEKVKPIPEKDLVKVILKGYISEENNMDLYYLEKEFINIFYLFKLYDETELHINYTKYEKDISLKGQFIRTVQKAPGSEEYKKRIIMLGLKALERGELE